MLHTVSSEDRLSGSSTDFVTEMRIPSEHTTAALVSIQFPKSYYLIHEGKNQFMIGSTTYSIDEGNYSLTELLTSLNTKIAPNSVEYLKRISKLKFYSSQSTLQFPASSELHTVFGFDRSSVYNFITGSLTAPHIINLNSISNVYITSDMCTDMSAGSYGSQLHAFAVVQPDLSIVDHTNPHIDIGKRLAFGKSAGLSEFLTITPRFKILDQNGSVIDLNGHNVTMIIKTFREDRTHDLLRWYGNAILTYIQELRQKSDQKQ
jgi:hypothetical protein